MEHKLKSSEYNARKTIKDTATSALSDVKGKTNSLATLKERIEAIEALLGIK